MKIERKNKVITITFDSEWDAENIEHAMNRGQWVNFTNSAKICKSGEEPTITELSAVLASTTYEFFKPNCKIVKIESPTFNKNKLEFNENHENIYIEHIHGYSGSYKEKAKLLLSVGFTVLRSISEPFTYNTTNDAGEIVEKTEMQHWEIWFLPGSCLATGELKGKKQKEIIEWIWKNISPGNVECGGQRWALSCE